MQQFTLNIRTKRLPNEIFTTVTRARRELCLSYARCTFPEETYLFDWEDGALLAGEAAWRLLPKDIARALANTLSPAELANCLQDAISDDESRAPGAALAGVAATLKENTDLDEKVVVWAMKAAVEREAALRYQALVTGERADTNLAIN